jgi:hypothetical protein
MTQRAQTPRADRLRHPLIGLIHLIFIVLGWLYFCLSWWMVIEHAAGATLLNLLIVTALVAFPAVTLYWVFHNQRLYKRLGPRKAPVMVNAVYEVDFNGCRVEANWDDLQTCRRIVITRQENLKRYRRADEDLLSMDCAQTALGVAA